MRSQDLHVGEHYAVRAQPRDRDAPLTRVRLVGPVRTGQAKVEHADGEISGLVEWLPTRTFQCRWAERRAFLRDEQRAHAIELAAEQQWDQVVADAVSHVLTATGEEGGFLRRWTLSPEKARRLWVRGEIEEPPEAHPLAFVDRHGMLHLPYEMTVRFAQAFAAAEPDAVMLYLRGWEERLEAEGWQPGSSSAHEFLRQSRPSHALTRQWAGSGEVDVLTKEVERLRRVVRAAVEVMRRDGLEADADRIEQGLLGR